MSQLPYPPSDAGDPQDPGYDPYSGQYLPPQHPGRPAPGGGFGPPQGQPYGEYSGAQQGYGPPSGSAPQSVRLQLGLRTRVRPEPRLGISLASAGAALLLVGALVWAGGYLIEGLFSGFGDPDSDGPDTSRRFLGVGLFLALLLAGYASAVLRREGPLATAGAVVGAFALPLAMLFVTASAGGAPVDVDAVYLVSILGWLASYLLVPGTRGRTFLLGLVLIGFPGYIGIKIAGDDALSVVGSVGGLPTSTPDTSAPSAVALVFGVLYLAAAVVADRKGRGGTATAFVVATLVLFASGTVGLAGELGVTGTGVLLLALGVALARYGAWARRRATTWLGAAAVAGGVFLIVADNTSDSYVAGGITLMVVGAAVIALAAGAAHALGETADVPAVGELSPDGPHHGPDQGPDRGTAGHTPQP